MKFKWRSARTGKLIARIAVEYKIDKADAVRIVAELIVQQAYEPSDWEELKLAGGESRDNLSNTIRFQVGDYFYCKNNMNSVDLSDAYDEEQIARLIEIATQKVERAFPELKEEA